MNWPTVSMTFLFWRILFISFNSVAGLYFFLLSGSSLNANSSAKSFRFVAIMPKTKTAKRYWRAKQVVVPRQVTVKQKHPVPDVDLVKDQKISFYVCRKEDEHNKSRHMDLRTNDKKVADSWARAKGVLEIERL